MVDKFHQVLQIIDRCYEAASDDNYWPDLLKEIRYFLDGDGATLRFTDTQLNPSGCFFGDNVSPQFITDYHAHFHSVDIRMQRAIPGALNKIATDLDLVDEATINGHEFYRDFLRPTGFRYIVSAVLDLGDGSYAFCSSHRGLQRDHADGDILDRALLLLPHLRRSLQLRNRICSVRAKGDAAFEVLDGLGHAVLLIDAQGRTLWQNAWADRLLRQQDGLMTSEGELRTLSAPANTELQALIGSAINLSNQPRARAGGLMSISRPSLKRPYQVFVTPLAKGQEATFTSRQLSVTPAAAIFIMDLEQKSVPRIEVLRTLYNLTPAEARLAIALGSGIAAKDYAEKAGLSIHYVRWLIKQVEAKTDTRRITDLIRLLARQSGVFGAAIDNKKDKS